MPSHSSSAGINDMLAAHGNSHQMTGACRWCSGPFQAVVHSGPCPRIRAIEYHPNGTVKRVEFKDGTNG